MKSLKSLYEGDIVVESSSLYDNKLFRMPGILDVLKYGYHFLISRIIIRKRGLNERLGLRRYNRWELRHSKGTIFDSHYIS